MKDTCAIQVDIFTRLPSLLLAHPPADRPCRLDVLFRVHRYPYIPRVCAALALHHGKDKQVPSRESVCWGKERPLIRSGTHQSPVLLDWELLVSSYSVVTWPVTIQDLTGSLHIITTKEKKSNGTLHAKHNNTIMLASPAMHATMDNMLSFNC